MPGFLSWSAKALLLIFLTGTMANMASNSRPVHENTNQTPHQHLVEAVQPFYNPLLQDRPGSQMNKEYLQEQQTMYQAERLRQQRAQLQKYQAPMQTDSYMKAYHDLQEKHHLKLEQVHNHKKGRTNGFLNGRHRPMHNFGHMHTNVKPSYMMKETFGPMHTNVKPSYMVKETFGQMHTNVKPSSMMESFGHMHTNVKPSSMMKESFGHMHANMKPSSMMKEAFEFGRYASNARPQQFHTFQQSHNLNSPQFVPETPRIVRTPLNHNLSPLSPTEESLKETYRIQQMIEQNHGGKMQPTRDNDQHIPNSVSFKFTSEDAMRYDPMKPANEQTNYLKDDYVKMADNFQVISDQNSLNTIEDSRPNDFRPSQPVNNLVNVQMPTTHKPIQMTKEEAMKSVNKNTRSPVDDFGFQYLNQDMRPLWAAVQSPSAAEGVTIKPNGNLGVATESPTPIPFITQMYTEAIPSKTQVIYPKQFNQMQKYKSAYDIGLLQTHADTADNEVELPQPIDLLFYIKDASSLPDQRLVTTATTPDYEVGAFKDLTPIKTEVIDIPRPFKTHNQQHIQPNFIPESPKEHADSNEVTANNYYKVEVSSQVVSNPKTETPPIELHVQDVTETIQTYGPNYQYGYQPAISYFTQHSKPVEEQIQELHNEPQAEHHEGSSFEDEPGGYAEGYGFGYSVQDPGSGNSFGHQEHRAAGDDQVRGAYHVALPDGTLQVVRYAAGPHGYLAQVSYHVA